jgi:hypothetical protein
VRFVCRITKATDTLRTQYLLLFHGNNGFGKVPQCYVIRTLPVRFCSACSGVPALAAALQVSFWIPREDACIVSVGNMLTHQVTHWYWLHNTFSNHYSVHWTAPKCGPLGASAEQVAHSTDSRAKFCDFRASRLAQEHLSFPDTDWPHRQYCLS